MEEAEIEAATKALLRWFQSQEIRPADCVLVMITALRLDLVAKMLRED